MANFMSVSASEAMANNQIANAKDQAKNKATQDVRTTDRYKKYIQNIKAQRLDQVDVCNINDPDSSISPCGCHYSKNDIEQTMSTFNYTREKAIEALSITVKYTTILSSKINSIDTSDETLLKWAQNRNMNVPSEYLEAYGLKTNEEGTKGNPESTSATNEQLNRAKSQRVSEPTDNIEVLTPGSAAYGGNTNVGQQLKQDDYIPWLCKLFNELCRTDSIKPQIPTSVAVSMALALTGIDTSNIGKYNFWKLRYDKSISGLGNENGMCGFSTDADGARGCLVYAHSCTNEITGLADKMEDTTEDVKQKVTKALLFKISPDGASPLVNSANNYVTKYKLREWDTNKTEAEGGHADTKRDNKSNVNNVIQKAIQKTIETLQNKGTGFQFIPRGADYTEVIKLPIGKTPCEPIYPDFIEVGDTVPEWVLSQTYAQVKKDIQMNMSGNGGVNTMADAASLENQKKLEAINKEIEAFKETQFAKWIQSKGLSYTNETEKNAAKEQYRQAARDDVEHFMDDIYIADDSDKAIYNNLIKRKNDITGDIGNNVEGTQAKKVEVEQEKKTGLNEAGSEVK